MFCMAPGLKSFSKPKAEILKTKKPISKPNRETGSFGNTETVKIRNGFDELWHKPITIV